jgi:hypothetical protein
MRGLVRDTVHAVRMSAHQPGFSLVVVLTLALGIGAVTAMFSVVNATLIRPLPFPSPSGHRRFGIGESRRRTGASEPLMLTRPVALVLLIACSNLTSLLLARASVAASVLGSCSLCSVHSLPIR